MAQSKINTSSGSSGPVYEVWLIKLSVWFLLQASYLYTHSVLRGVTFEVLPLSSCALSPTMLPLLETFPELLLWNSVQCRRHYLPLFKVYCIFGKSRKAFRTTSGEKVGYSVSVMDLLIENTLWAGALSWWRIQSLGKISGLFLRQSFTWRFRLTDLAEWIQSEQYYPWYRRKVASSVFICDFDMRALFESFMPLRNTWLFS